MARDTLRAFRYLDCIHVLYSKLQTFAYLTKEPCHSRCESTVSDRVACALLPSDVLPSFPLILRAFDARPHLHSSLHTTEQQKFLRYGLLLVATATPLSPHLINWLHYGPSDIDVVVALVEKP